MFSINRKMKIIIVLLLFTTSIYSLNTIHMFASGPLDMEYSHKWSETSVNAYDICAADVDGDGVVEIVSAGWIWDGSSYWAQLRIYSWDGSVFNVEISREFQIDGEMTIGEGVCVCDLGNDGTLEIIVTGFAIPTTGDIPGWIRVYRWDGSVLALLDTMTWTGSTCNSFAVAAGDLDGNGYPEVVSAGAYYDSGTGYRYAQLNVWSWNGGLNFEDREEWTNAAREDSNVAVDVALGELDGQVMIAVAEYFTDTCDLKGKARVTIWSYSSSLSFEESVIWDAVGNTVCYGVFVDDDKIYTVGYADDGINTEGQLRVWTYGSLTLEDSIEWLVGSYTYANEVYVADLDGDDEKEIVVVGEGTDGTRANALLDIWNFDFTIGSKDSENWYSIDNTEAEAVYVADVDDDGVPEILTSGYADYLGAGQVTIWSYPDNFDPVISGFDPLSGAEVQNTKPTISAMLGDDFSGIDVNSVTIIVEGVDVTSEAIITVTNLSYTPTSDFSEGDIVVTVDVQDKSGNSATATWTFTVKPPAPGIPGFPLEGMILGIAVAAVALFLLRKRTITSSSMPPTV